MLNADKLVPGIIKRADNLIQLGLKCRGVSVLHILDYEHHEEGDDCCRRIDDELPTIRPSKNGASYDPQRNKCDRQDEGCWLAGNEGC